MAKEIISFPDMVTDLGGFDLLASAALKANGQKENKDIFKARVIKEIPVFSAQEIAAIGGFSEIESFARSTQTQAFYVQIVERSPHSYLPDPCPQGGTGEADRANNSVVQSLYTIALEQQGLSLRPDDMVFVKLNKRDFSYDTDFGWIQSKAGAGQQFFKDNQSCAKASAGFNKKKIKPLVSAESMLKITSPNPDGTVFVFADGVSVEPTSREAITAFTNMLTQVLKAEDIPKLFISSGYRDPSRQAQALRDLKGGKCRGNIPNGIPLEKGGDAAEHSCRQIFNMYNNKNLMKELMKLDWNTKDLENKLREEEEKGNILSKHQRKGALDLQTPRISGKDKKDKNGNRIQMKLEVQEKIINAVKQFGGVANYESAPPHMHIDMPSNLVDKIQNRELVAASSRANTTEDINETRT